MIFTSRQIFRSSAAPAGSSPPALARVPVARAQTEAGAIGITVARREEDRRVVETPRCPALACARADDPRQLGDETAPRRERGRATHVAKDARREDDDAGEMRQQ